MPLVLCIALGTNLGGHNGTSLLSAMLDAYASTLNRSVVISSGNGAVQRRHFSHEFLNMNDVAEAEIRVEEGVNGFVVELWTTVPNIMTVAFTSPSGERTGYISFKQGYEYREEFLFDQTDVEVEYRLLLENNDSQLIFMPLPGNLANQHKARPDIRRKIPPVASGTGIRNRRRLLPPGQSGYNTGRAREQPGGNDGCILQWNR